MLCFSKNVVALWSFVRRIECAPGAMKQLFNCIFIERSLPAAYCTFNEELLRTRMMTLVQQLAIFMKIWTI
jgi:hypothetical protein